MIAVRSLEPVPMGHEPCQLTTLLKIDHSVTVSESDFQLRYSNTTLRTSQSVHQAENGHLEIHGRIQFQDGLRRQPSQHRRTNGDLYQKRDTTKGWQCAIMICTPFLPVQQKVEASGNATTDDKTPLTRRSIRFTEVCNNRQIRKCRVSLVPTQLQGVAPEAKFTIQSHHDVTTVYR